MYCVTTLAEFVHGRIARLAATGAVRRRKSCEREALERSFKQLRFTIGKGALKREDLYERRKPS